MKRATASLRLTPACVGLALVFLGGTGVVPAAAYDDKSTLTSVLGFIGVYSDEDESQKIVFREHPKLVVPPNRQGLPSPQAETERPASWPVDQEIARRKGAPAPARQPGLNENPNVAGSKNGEHDGPRKCLVAASDGHCTIATDADEPGAATGPKTRGAGEASTRSYLTEPPQAYRQKVAGGKGVKEAEEKPGWTNPIGMIGSLFGGS
ncbi:hypothetical protein EDE12_101365 [Methylosinus sp. sav-2]|jgi:hypothetical protein|uniref:hypothetical protein n=1 Tax=unclassified Methylosinus TaxID=2624500 RepID=UPI00047C1F70|nr:MULTISPECIES: hypothetical protein [unclassified Methylosinus]TDX66829.1 hypothetical protein EDE12_101365 [Methylosinus sp. sav-2]